MLAEVTDVLPLAMDVAALRGIEPKVAIAAIEACLAGDTRPLYRLGYDVKAKAPEAALAEVACYSEGQAEAWLRTFDAQMRQVRE